VSATAKDERGTYIAGIKSYIYGYPMVIMDVTRDVLTAALCVDRRADPG
jgi:hypothetical protein